MCAGGGAHWPRRAEWVLDRNCQLRVAGGQGGGIRGEATHWLVCRAGVQGYGEDCWGCCAGLLCRHTGSCLQGEWVVAPGLRLQHLHQQHNLLGWRLAVRVRELRAGGAGGCTSSPCGSGSLRHTHCSHPRPLAPSPACPHAPKPPLNHPPTHPLTLPATPCRFLGPSRAAMARTSRLFSGCCQAHSNCRAWVWVGKPYTTSTISQGRHLAGASRKKGGRARGTAVDGC